MSVRCRLGRHRWRAHWQRSAIEGRPIYLCLRCGVPKNEEQR